MVISLVHQIQGGIIVAVVDSIAQFVYHPETHAGAISSSGPLSYWYSHQPMILTFLTDTQNFRNVLNSS